jgi:hypothetical protein
MCQGEESGTRESSGAATVTRTSWAKAGSLAAGDRTTTTLMHDAAGWWCVRRGEQCSVRLRVGWWWHVSVGSALPPRTAGAMLILAAGQPQEMLMVKNGECVHSRNLHLFFLWWVNVKLIHGRPLFPARCHVQTPACRTCTHQLDISKAPKRINLCRRDPYRC